MIQRGRQGNFGERGATSLSMPALPHDDISPENLKIRHTASRDRAAPDAISARADFISSRLPMCVISIARQVRTIARAAPSPARRKIGRREWEKMFRLCACFRACLSHTRARARIHWKKGRSDTQMLALIAKVVFFHRQRLVALNLVSVRTV